ncbi:MAG: cytochrome c biogenesis protein CcdA [Chloroflexota bacterium]
MNELFQAFILGNAAILTNVCILPLYPGLIAYMAGNAKNERAQRATNWLGLLVLAGVLSMMVLIGAIVFVLQQSFNSVLPVLLPIIYIVVILLGILMIFGKNPFARLSQPQVPVLNNPYSGAYVYGLLLGPMTLPCTGPIITTALLLSNTPSDLVGELAYFLAFGFGFGWPLVFLPLVATSFQRNFTKWMTQNYKLMTRLSGVLLIAIGIFGYVADFTDILF